MASCVVSFAQSCTVTHDTEKRPKLDGSQTIRGRTRIPRCVRERRASVRLCSLSCVAGRVLTRVLTCVVPAEKKKENSWTRVFFGPCFLINKAFRQGMATD